MKLSAFLLTFAGSATATLLVLGAPADKKGPSDRFHQIARANLDVSDGQVGENGDGFLTIASPEVRATETARNAKAARLVFTFHGPTAQRSKLASGEEALQIGLKLRAKNTCNLLYAMWKLDGQQRVAVSVKRNPGMSTHTECGASGYVNVQPAFQEKPEKFPSAKDEKPHTLEAWVSKPDPKAYELVVKADGNVVWQGPIEAQLLDDIEGPAGFRSDNGVFTFKFYALEASAIKYAAWKHDKKKDRYSCECRYPAKNNPNRINAQVVTWYPNDAERKGYYYFAKGNALWARCVCPKNAAYDPKVMQWSIFENKSWSDLPAGECPAPKDGDPGRASIEAIPDPPA